MPRRDELWDAILPIAAGVMVAACASTVDVAPREPIEVMSEGPREILAGEPDPIPESPREGIHDPLEPPESPRVVVVHDGGAHHTPEKVFFRENSARISPNSHDLLDEIVSVLKQNPQVLRVAVEGHADPREASPISLGRARAKAVRNFLVDKGIAPERLVVESHASQRPLADSSTPAGQARNRRVQFRILEQV